MAKLPTPEEEDEQFEFMRSVGKRVGVMREKSGLSRRQMTDRAGLKHAYGYMIEEGGQNFTLKTLITLAQVLGCTPRDLMPDPPEDANAEPELQLIRQRVKLHLESFEAIDKSLGLLRESVESTKRFGQG